MSMDFENILDGTQLLKKHKFYVEKGHNSVKMLDRVTSSCLHIVDMMVNKCAK
jgi:hypothetical protein